ncbi:hypothetical protein Efla_005015 [Eimeria flavescens]
MLQQGLAAWGLQRQRPSRLLLLLPSTIQLLLLLLLLLLLEQALEGRAAVFAGSSNSSTKGSAATFTAVSSSDRCCCCSSIGGSNRSLALRLCWLSLPAPRTDTQGTARTVSSGPAVAAAVAAAAIDADNSSSSSTSGEHDSCSSSSCNESSSSSSSNGWGTLPRAALEGISRPLRVKPKKKRGRPRLSDSLAGLLATQHAALSGAAAAAAAAAAARAGGAAGSGWQAAASSEAFYASLPVLPLPQRGLGRLRVCGGRLARRRLLMPRTDETRPMMERVRAAVFSMLHSLGVFSRPGLRVLDLFGGSGALAIESLSRGAQHATVVDRSLDCCEAGPPNPTRLALNLSPSSRRLRAAPVGLAATQAAAVNLRHLGCTDSRVLRLCVFELLLAPQRFLFQDTSSSSSSDSSSSSGAQFDLVFLCPPYTEVVYGDLLEKLLLSGLLKPGGLLVVEYPKELGCLPLRIGFPRAPVELEGLRNRRYGRTCVALYAAWPSRHSSEPASAVAAAEGDENNAAATDRQQEHGPLHLPAYISAPNEFEPPGKHRKSSNKRAQQQQQQQNAVATGQQRESRWRCAASSLLQLLLPQQQVAEARGAGPQTFLSRLLPVAFALRGPWGPRCLHRSTEQRQAGAASRV